YVISRSAGPCHRNNEREWRTGAPALVIATQQRGADRAFAARRPESGSEDLDAYCFSRNSNGDIKYRSFFQTGQVWPPESMCQMWGTCFSSSPAWNVLLPAKSRSVSPQETQSSRSFLLASAGSAMRLAPEAEPPAPEYAPSQANTSRCLRPIRNDCPAPIDRPAKARCSRPASTG